MPNLKSAKKELRKNKTRHEFNKKIEDGVKNLIKKSRKAIEAKQADAAEIVKITLKAIDKAAEKGIIKKNARDRKKSRLHLKLNGMNKKEEVKEVKKPVKTKTASKAAPKKAAAKKTTVKKAVAKKTTKK